ncbi:REP element-mobilizing transposase RayT [Alkaliphilus hydrothermalis]|uniref:REP element-mobilizing transposase RayT n=2 Tax=Alkaliphilus hydrothermalis TaxID=1482730 RepID=A0ABS2NQC8_9FIRM|nr:REP element-mobilizing transposase RayT [Alkaliphilus hydrothermalis]
MPRTSREKSRTGIYHILLRGIYRERVFEEDIDKLELMRIINNYVVVMGKVVNGKFVAETIVISE